MGGFWSNLSSKILKIDEITAGIWRKVGDNQEKCQIWSNLSYFNKVFLKIIWNWKTEKLWKSSKDFYWTFELYVRCNTNLISQSVTELSEEIPRMSLPQNFPKPCSLVCENYLPKFLTISSHCFKPNNKFS